MDPIKDSDIPEPGDPLDPPDPEFERLLAWFVRSRRRIAWTYNADEVIVRPKYESDKPGKDLPGGIMLIKDGKISIWKKPKK